jgi:hypothetical protein
MSRQENTISLILVPFQATLHFLLVFFLFLNKSFDLVIQFLIPSNHSIDRLIFSYDSFYPLVREGTLIIEIFQNLFPYLKVLKRIFVDSNHQHL